jgi:hypothetical protein
MPEKHQHKENQKDDRQSSIYGDYGSYKECDDCCNLGNCGRCTTCGKRQKFDRGCKNNKDKRYQCAIENINRGICMVKDGFEAICAASKKLCSNPDESCRCIQEAINDIRKGLCYLLRGIRCIQFTIGCRDLQMTYQGLCHISKSLGDFGKAIEAIRCGDEKCAMESMEEGICDLDEGIEKLLKGLRNTI